MYTLEEIYDQHKVAVECLTQDEVSTFIDMVRTNPPPNFCDYWAGDSFEPPAPTCISIHLYDSDEDRAHFGWSDREWYEDEGYLVISLNETGNEPRELVSEGLESLFNLEVL